MRIDDIAIKDIDTSLSTKGGRLLRVRCGSHSFLTPTRPISTQEIRAKSFLGYRPELSAQIAALPVDFSTEARRKKFFLNNGFLHEEERLLQSFSDTVYTIPSMPVIQIKPLHETDMEAFKIAFEMQRSIEGIDILSMPLFEAGKEQFERMVKNWSESSEECGLGSAVHLSLKDDVRSFSDKLDILSEFTKSGAVQSINIQFENVSKCRQQLAALWNRRDRLNAIINCTEVPSNSTELSPEIMSDAESLLLQNGFDMITKKRYQINQKQIMHLAAQPPPSSLDGIDSFKISEHSASASIKGGLWRRMKHPPECDCSVCRGMGRDRIIDRFAYLDNGDVSKSGMRYFSNLHDHQSDLLELEVFRKYTSSDGAEEYDKRLKENLENLQKQK